MQCVSSEGFWFFTWHCFSLDSEDKTQTGCEGENLTGASPSANTACRSVSVAALSSAHCWHIQTLVRSLRASKPEQKVPQQQDSVLKRGQWKVPWSHTWQSNPVSVSSRGMEDLGLPCWLRFSASTPVRNGGEGLIPRGAVGPTPHLGSLHTWWREVAPVEVWRSVATAISPDAGQVAAVP